RPAVGGGTGGGAGGGSTGGLAAVSAGLVSAGLVSAGLVSIGGVVSAGLSPVGSAGLSMTSFHTKNAAAATIARIRRPSTIGQMRDGCGATGGTGVEICCSL